MTTCSFADAQADDKRIFNFNETGLRKSADLSLQPGFVQRQDLGQVHHRGVLKTALIHVQDHGDRILFYRGRNGRHNSSACMDVSDVVLDYERRPDTLLLTPPAGTEIHHPHLTSTTGARL